MYPASPLALVIGVAAVLAAPAAAQQPAATQGVVVGTVRDASTGAPVAGARVGIEDRELHVATDSAGRFMLRGVPPGPQVLTVERIGFATVRQPLTVPPGGTVRQDLALAPSALEVPGITVTADPGGRARGELGTATVVGREAIEAQSAVSLAGILELVPGMPATPPGLDAVQQIALRGVPIGTAPAGSAPGASAGDLASFGTVIILDGVPLSNNANLQTLGPRGEVSFPSGTSGGGIDIRRIPASTIDRVEVIRGIPSARYGDLTQGAIVIDTRAGEVEPVLGGRLDRRTRSLNLMGGRAVGGHGGTATFDVAHTRLAPGLRPDDAYRLSGQLAHRWAAGADAPGTTPRAALDTRLDFYRLASDNPEEPELNPGRASWNQDQGFRLSQRAMVTLPWASRLRVTAAVDGARQRSWITSMRVRQALPFTDRLDEGRAVGRFVGGSYQSELFIDGDPWLVFGRAEIEASRAASISEHDLRVGVEVRREWNAGEGYRFDMEFPPQASFGVVGGFDRPRRFADAQPLATTALYIDDRIRLPLPGGGMAMVQAGVRVDVLHDGSHWLTGSRSTVLQPRLNAELAPWPWLRLRGGYGRMAKAPGMASLHPAPQYFDIVNVNWYANDPAERLAVLTTFIIDPTNDELRHGVATKSEAGIEVALGRDGILSAVAFSDRIEDGIGARFQTGSLSRDIYQLSDSTAGTGRPPEIIEPPERTEVIPVLVHQPANNLNLATRGVELTASLPEIRPLRTRLQVQGAWIRSALTRSDPEFGVPSQFEQFQLDPSRPRAPYWEGIERHGDRTLLSYRLIHHQPALGLIVTTTIQHDVSETRRVVGATDSLAFAGYVTRDGSLVPIPPERRGDAEFQDLHRARQLPSAGEVPDGWFLSLQVSKTLPLNGRFSFYAFNALDRIGRYSQPGVPSRLYPAVRFGLDLSVTAEALAWWR